MINIVVYLMLNKELALEKMKVRNGGIIDMEKMRYSFLEEFLEEKKTFTPRPDGKICKYCDEDIKILEELGEPVTEEDYYLPTKK